MRRVENKYDAEHFAIMRIFDLLKDNIEEFYQNWEEIGPRNDTEPKDKWTDFKYNTEELKKKVDDLVNNYGPNLEIVERRLCKVLHQLQGHNTYRKTKVQEITIFWNENKDYLLSNMNLK